MKKFVRGVAGTALFVWAFLVVVLPGLDVIAYRNGRFPSGAEEFYMADGFRGGTLVVRDYWHCKFPGGFEREYGRITYGWGGKYVDLSIEVTRVPGSEPKVVNAMTRDGHLSQAEAIREGQRSIDL